MCVCVCGWVCVCDKMFEPKTSFISQLENCWRLIIWNFFEIIYIFWNGIFWQCFILCCRFVGYTADRRTQRGCARVWGVVWPNIHCIKSIRQILWIEMLGKAFCSIHIINININSTFTLHNGTIRKHLKKVAVKHITKIRISFILFFS